MHYEIKSYLQNLMLFGLSKVFWLHDDRLDKFEAFMFAKDTIYGETKRVLGTLEIIY